MKSNKLIIGLKMIFLATFFIGCNDNDDNGSVIYEERVVVANRNGASISFIDASSNQVLNTLTIPGSEPMYVVYVSQNDKIYVGDRAQNMVHIVNPKTLAVESSIKVGVGVFHMWADGQGKQLWVVTDTDKKIYVINLSTNAVIKDFSVDFTPHDVFLTKDGSTAYVSLFNSDTTKPDKVYMYSTSTFAKTGEASVGKDPHLFHLPTSNKLFVACQSGEVYVLNGSDLSKIDQKPYPGAHGIYGSPDQSTVFATNIVGAQLYSINASTYAQNGSPLASLSPTPHNIVVNNDGNKMFVTHSGASATAVSTYSINAATSTSGQTLTAGSIITAGKNPFGLTYYRRNVY